LLIGFLLLDTEVPAPADAFLLLPFFVFLDLETAAAAASLKRPSKAAAASSCELARGRALGEYLDEDVDAEEGLTVPAVDFLPADGAADASSFPGLPGAATTVAASEEGGWATAPFSSGFSFGGAEEGGGTTVTSSAMSLEKREGG